MPFTARTRELVLASFVSLSVGFVAGWWMARPDDTSVDESPAAPHDVGPREYVQLGMQSLEQGSFEEAERLFREAIQRQPDSAELQADLAVALIYQERWGDAHAALERAKALAPDAPEVLFLEGIVYREGLADTARARASWTKFLSMVPDSAPQAVTVRGWMAEMESGKPPGGGPDAPPAPGSTRD